MCDSSYLVSVTEALCLGNEIVRWIGRCCFNGVAAPDLGEIDAEIDAETYVRSMKARTLHRQGRIAEALAISVGSAAFAEIVVDAPSSVLDPDAIVRACNAASDAEDLLLIERGLACCGRGERSAIVDDDRYADAIGHAARGELSAALDALEDAALSYSPYVMFAAVDPQFVPLRPEKRFADLLRELRLSESVDSTRLSS